MDSTKLVAFSCVANAVFSGAAATNLDLGYSYLVSSDRVQWEEAWDACVKMGYSLASIDSEAENDFIVNTLIKNTPGK